MSLSEPDRLKKVTDLKSTKRKLKTHITKLRSSIVNNGDFPKLLQDIDLAHDQTYAVLDKLYIYDPDNLKIYEQEYEKIQQTHDGIIASIVEMQTRTLAMFPDPAHFKQPDENKKEENKFSVDNDMYRQLKRVSIPKFSGDKKQYLLFKEAFTECIHKTKCADSYKMLQLREYLSGEALKAVELFPASDIGYKAALEKLDLKYGGERRQLIQALESVHRMKLCNGDLKSLEEFSDKLDVAIVSLKANNRLEEFQAESMFFTVTKTKLPANLVAHYKRWLAGGEEKIDTLKQWLDHEIKLRGESQEEGFKSFNRNSNPHTGGRAYVTNNFNQSCILCNSTDHKLGYCSEFKKLTIDKRWYIVKQHRLCFCCLGKFHVSTKCYKAKPCLVKGCSKYHHILLHEEGQHSKLDYRAPSFQPKNGPKQSSTNVVQSLELPIERQINLQCENRDEVNPIIAMRMLPVILKNGNREIEINALFDECSTASYVNKNIAQKLGLEVNDKKQLDVSVLGGRKSTIKTSQVSFDILRVSDHAKTGRIKAYTVNSVTGDMRMIDWRKYKNIWPHLEGIDFPVVRREGIDLLIGLDAPELHRSFGEISGRSGEPVARILSLGITCVGIIPKFEDKVFMSHFVRTHLTEKRNDLDVLLQRMWNVESVGISKNLELTKKEKSIIESTDKFMKFIDGRYQVSIPWKENEPNILNNKEMAIARLQSLERSLISKPIIANEYRKIISDQIEKGYVRKVPINEQNLEHSFYLPHFAVTRFDKATTKVRVVMDGAARSQGKSLNDCIHAGPALQRQLMDVLIRFRYNPVALVADIAEMFLQISLDPKDRKYHRFLWRDMDQNAPIEEFEYLRLVFGNCASPYLSQSVLRAHATSNCDKYPLASSSVLDSMYIDDLMDSCININDCIQLRHQTTELLSKAGFKIRKWLSNKKEVLADIPEQDRAPSVQLDSAELPAVKTLGVLWEANSDKFGFKVEGVDTEFKYTKRNVFKKAATLYDPLNFLAPYTIRAKIYMQRAWVKGIQSWDDLLPQDLVNEWKNWFTELYELRTITISRCLVFEKLIVEKTLQTFVDSSELAYSAITYLRCKYASGEISSIMIASKTRVAPLKALSIPKLELSGAIIGLRLSENIRKVLNIDRSDITYWSDSLNVLYWIKGESRRYKPFVAHRVGEIHDSSTPSQWRYVPTKLNSADLATRGLSASELRESNLWWNGPSFLLESEDNWPKNRSETPTDEAKAEIRANAQTCVSAVVKKLDLGRLDPSRYSSWKHLIKITAWILRYINNLKDKAKRNHAKVLSISELNNAEYYWFKHAQNAEFSTEINELKKHKSISSSSQLSKFNPKLDENGILRVGGRLENATKLSYDAQFPIILPRTNDITRLVLFNEHENCNHAAGTEHVLANVRSKFWVLHGREAIKSYLKCYECMHRKNTAARQIMAPLPNMRLGDPLRAFSRVGVDYAGPYLTKQGRGKVRAKRYLCLFTCLASRAVHLEMAWSMDSDSFLAAFSRFTNRRGKPLQVLSDNGSNFQGAERELRELIDLLDKDKINDSMANQKIEWKFNPPIAPHFGGVFESLIKSSKRALKAILGNAEVNDEELLSAIVCVEGLLNSRPLTYQSSHPNDEPVLTPNHFLHGQASGQLAPDSVDSDFLPRKRWRRIQELVNHFWKRWIREFLPTLNARNKWRKSENNLKVDDVVLVVDPQVARGKWPLGRVIEVMPGTDGHVRVVRVKVGNASFIRPIHRLVPITELK